MNIFDKALIDLNEIENIFLDACFKLEEETKGENNG